MQEFSVRAKVDEPLVKLLQAEVKKHFAAGGQDRLPSNSKIRRLLVAGCVSVNGRQIFVPSFVVRKGCLVCVKIEEDKFFAEKQVADAAFSLSEKDVLFEDEALLVVNKPCRFPTEQTVTGNRANLHDEVVRYLWQKNQALRNPPYAGLMHRLDRDTSGAILFTKSRSVNKAIFGQFEKRSVEKVYRAVTTAGHDGRNIRCFDAGGNLSSLGNWGQKDLPLSFSVENFLARQSAKSAQAKWHGTTSEAKGSLFALTDFEVLAQGKFCGQDALFVEARPRTGRTHQIRVHLAESGLAILGDKIYGDCANVGERLMLHAHKLSFVHPTSGEKICVTAPLPPAFEPEA